MAQLAFDILARDRASKVFDQVGAKSQKTEQRLSRMGSTTGAMFGKLTTAVGGLALGWQAWDKVVAGGFNRLANLDDARKRLDQMGVSTSEAKKLMDGLTETVTGTAFSLDAGAGAMTGFVSAGVDLDEVNDRLRMTADTAAFAQAPLDEIGNIFVKIQTQGKLTAEELNMLAERGVPALALLADAAGVTTMAMQEMISRGEVDAERFFDLWEEGSKGFGENNIVIEGAAKSMGDTIRGSLANAETALNRLGATILDEFMPAIKGVAEGFGAAADGVGEFIEVTAPFRDFLGDTVGQLIEIDKGILEFLGVMDDSAETTDYFNNIAARWPAIAEDFISSTSEAAEELGEVADQTAAATEALSVYQEALKASTDPVFALRNALSKVTEAQTALEAVRSDSGATTQEVADAEWALFEALTNADAAAHNSELSFQGVNAVLDDMVAKGLITAETAESLRGQIEDTTAAAEDYTGPYVADLQAEIDDPAIRDAQRQLDAVARMRSPRYRAELDRQAEVRARNRLNAVANTRNARINALAANAARVNSQLDSVARNRFATVYVSYAVSGGIPAGLTRGHSGGMLTASGVKRYHSGGVLPRFHGGGDLFGRMSGNEVPFIGLRGERVLSISQTKALHQLVGTLGKSAGSSAGASRAAGMDPQSWAHALVRELQRAGLVLPRVDLARRADLFARSG